MLGYIKQKITNCGEGIMSTISRFGSFLIYSTNCFRVMFSPPFRLNSIVEQSEFIGNRSLNIILLSAFAIGAVFGLQLGIVFSIFKAEGMMGAATAKSLARELSPMVTAFLISGRAGASVTAEISTMKVTEQIDAMEVMGVDPMSYLVVPRVIACAIMSPLLTSIFSFVGMIGSFLIGVVMFNVDQGTFLDKTVFFVNIRDIVNGLEKSVVFGIITMLIACRYGLGASKGAKGVGEATTNSVIVTLLTLLGVDFLLTCIQVL